MSIGRNDFDFFEAGFLQHGATHGSRAERNVELAVVRQNRRQNARVPATARQQLQNAHVILKAEELQGL